MWVRSAEPHAVLPSAPASGRLFLEAELINGKKHVIGVRNGELAVPEPKHGKNTLSASGTASSPFRRPYTAKNHVFWQSDLGVKIICHVTTLNDQHREASSLVVLAWHGERNQNCSFFSLSLHSSLWYVEFDCECYSGSSRFKCALVDVCFFVSLNVVSQLKIFLFNATLWNRSTCFLKWF